MASNVRVLDSIGDLPPAVAGNGNLYVGDTRFGRLHALDPVTGELRWSAETNGLVTAAPAVAGCTVFVGTDGGTLHAVDGATGETVWKTTLASSVRAPPSVATGTVYVGDGAGQAYAVDATSGVRRWTKHLDGRVSASPTSVAGRLFVGGEETLYAIGGTVEERRGAVEAGVV